MANDSDTHNVLQNRGTDTSFLLLPFSAIAVAILLKILKDPIISVFSYNGSEYYALAGLCLIALVPYFCTAGLFPGKVSENTNIIENNSLTSNKSLKRFAFPVIGSFIFSLMCAVTIDPVQKEGWLRTMYASLIISTQAPVLVLLAELNKEGIISVIVRKMVIWLPVVALPAGLLLHRPWNIVTFFSPYYWCSWAWMAHPINESIVCGSITFGITIIMLLALNEIRRQALKRS
jgi:hypothetical protein